MEAGALTDSKTEMTAVATHPDNAGPSGTRSSKSYLTDYSKARPDKFTTTFE